MGKGAKTVVTHPDGSQSTRTSESRTYTHAVVISQTRESLVEDVLRQVEEYSRRAEALSAALDGEVTEESRSWSGGKTYYSLFVGGEYAGAHVSDKPRPTDEELRNHLREAAEASRKRATEKVADAVELRRTSPPVVYGVLRWSSRADLAQKAATGEFACMVRDGVEVYVQPID